ncbi:hypothetical protein G6M89_17550 [Natronolimnobius sp. AArcel1]|uniref:hypothetical protein n=1 Tax=Natronolimnobius sp. AArcel1 TaxID=1679093 RepID=UPI0013ED1AE4|nr:hypothetical protein [Natronolimnobius sp. AArcel1]NGM70783.1 hypothetical protein [Natronolimnobius sp. AArcel1]
MTAPDRPPETDTQLSDSDTSTELTSRGYRISVDDGRESFFAIYLGEPGSETAWIMSDTVYAPESMR